MSKFDQYTDKQLQDELAVRQWRQDEAGKPQQLEQVDLTRLRQNCQEIIDAVAGNGYYDNGCKQYVYESAMQAIFGKNVFDWMRERT